MEGRIFEIITSDRKGKVDTRNDNVGIITIFDLADDVQENATVEFELESDDNGEQYARFIRTVERNQTIFNTEDRDRWYEWGENEENDFLTNIVPRIQLDIRSNPEKAYKLWAIDLYDYTNDRYADLKTQNTPFFTCSKYNYKGKPYDPAYAVSFNKKDYEYYRRNYPECDIYFWINWTQLEYKTFRVQPVYGVWRAPFAKMAQLIESKEVALHTYAHRVNDDHNAKDSYIFSLADENVFEKIL
ncbi:MAG: hypothetical protein E7478_00375 [Ruminococcaceae bacterium]|nr:hypothetical protein [Oscillospiraceae bacterium]